MCIYIYMYLSLSIYIYIYMCIYIYIYIYMYQSLTDIMAGLKLVGKDGSVRGPEAVKDRELVYIYIYM